MKYVLRFFVLIITPLLICLFFAIYLPYVLFVKSVSYIRTGIWNEPVRDDVFDRPKMPSNS